MFGNQSGKNIKQRGLCTECQMGVLSLHYLTYFTWLDAQLITVPNFPAWICDVCGRREYDLQAITYLNTFLNPETGRSAAPRRSPNTGSTNQAQP